MLIRHALLKVFRENLFVVHVVANFLLTSESAVSDDVDAFEI
jgi:hypothetical protein